MHIQFFLLASICLFPPQEPQPAHELPYSWLSEIDSSQSLIHRLPPPSGYQRVSVPHNSFAHWLRHLPLLPGRPQVQLYNGQLKGNQSAHHAVLDIDVGKRDLQQCADAVMRLKAEYEYAAKAYDQINFRFTSGDMASYTRWQQGYRPKISGNSVNWVRSQAPSSTYKSFRAYLNTVFSYAGTYSLDRDLPLCGTEDPIEAGQIFIKGGFPGHAVIVLDVVKHYSSGERLFLLAQSYMPAQQIHILRNPTEPDLSPWYRFPKGALSTPEWRFPPNSRKYFP